MFTALRGFNSPLIPLSEAHRLYFALTPILKSALAELSIAPITRYTPSELDEPVLNVCSVYTVQAFLLYTFWPPLTSSVSADSSWYSLGIAIFQAIRIGIHLPGHSADGLSTQNPDLLAEQLRTWIACNIVSQTIATAFGFPGLNRLDLPRSRGLSHSEVSESLKQMLEIERFESQVAQTLNSNAFDPLMLVGPTERFPMMRLLERELDEMAMKLGVEVGTDSKAQGSAVGAENDAEGITTKGDKGGLTTTYDGSSAPTDAAGTIDGETYGNMDDFRVLCLHASRLHLLTYYFLDTDKVPEFDLSKGLIKAYNAAIKYITHCKFCQEHNPSFALHLPSVYTMTIWQAACIVARLIHSSYSSLIDVPLGRIRYLDAVSLAHEASVIKHDMAYRASGIMRSMWALFKTLNEQKELSPKVVVRSRMCASVFFDSLWILRQKCGMIKLKPDEEAVEESEESDSGKEQVSRPIQRSLSSTLHPESDARKIINTIPLDPQPISLSDKGESGSSSHSSPFMYKSPGERVRPVMRNVSSSSGPVKEGSAKEGPVNGVPVKGVPAKEVPATEAPVFSLDSWDLVNDIDSDLLFKDIDTVMNNFGFHAE
ncbi:DEKNAAC104005 [Brettanomyces naardenensis]|uniref:DEKNAAC104005 n=1 Tax=Brettanomyces naardenensis TaxID=13370 RepID=A0A448YQN2_BRENA|nr:DEKNAAC104005 [Brettanomyces naardenensis]